MNIVFTSPTAKTDTEAMQLLAILRDCGIDEIWQSPKLKLISFYLQNTAYNINDIKEEIGKENYAGLIKCAASMSRSMRNRTKLRVRNWLLSHANGCLLNQALRISAQEKRNIPAKAITYDRNNQEYVRDEDDFAKLVTLLMIEQFPTQLWCDQDVQLNKLTYYQYFIQEYGNSKTLQSFRRSIVQRERACLTRIIKDAKQQGRELKPKTTGIKKYMELSPYDRLRLMRYYRFVVAETDGELAP